MKVSEIKVSYSNTGGKKIKVNNSDTAWQVALSQWDMSIIEFQEEVKVILMNRANVVLGIYELSRGGSTSSVVDIKIILSVALKAHSSSIIIVHNHPSGNLQPSEADKRLTKRLKSACEVVDLVLLDHLIVTKESFYSFKDNDLL
jgi:DNA repair protein RadC